MVAGAARTDYVPPPMAATTSLYRRAPFALLALLPLVVPLAGCDLESTGEPPPVGRTNFPTALALAPDLDLNGDGLGNGHAHLLVVSSNFDLRYNKGSLQAFSLDAIDRAIAYCAPAPENGNREEGCAESTEGVLEIDPLSQQVDEDGGTVRALDGEVLIDSFGTGIAPGRVTEDGQGARVYIPIRSQSVLAYVDYEPTNEGDVLDCGGGGRSCGSDFERGDDSRVEDSARELSFPGEPVGVIAGPLTDWDADADAARDYVLIAHRPGEVSLFVDDEEGRPALTHTLDTFPLDVSGVMFDPETRLAYLMGAGKRLSRVGVALRDGAPEYARVYDGGELLLEGVGTSGDMRAGLILPGQAGAPSRAMLVGRVPSAFMQAELGPVSRTSVTAPVQRTVEVGSGPSRLATGTLTGEGGERIDVVAVSCFDGREVFILDRATGATLTVVPNFSGPFELAIDGARNRLYVADFRSSVVRIADLSPVLSVAARDVYEGVTEPTTATIVASIGRPRVVQELQ